MSRCRAQTNNVSSSVSLSRILIKLEVRLSWIPGSLFAGNLESTTKRPRIAALFIGLFSGRPPKHLGSSLRIRIEVILHSSAGFGCSTVPSPWQKPNRSPKKRKRRSLRSHRHLILGRAADWSAPTLRSLFCTKASSLTSYWNLPRNSLLMTGMHFISS